MSKKKRRDLSKFLKKVREARDRIIGGQPDNCRTTAEEQHLETRSK